MRLPFKTLDDIDLRNKRVLLRADINSSVDPRTKRISDDSRIVALVPTLRDLSRSKVVLIAHQGRPGSDDFISLEQHAGIIKNLGFRVSFVDDVYGESARRAIEQVNSGEVLVLQNVRYLDCEQKTGTPEDMAKEPLVQELYPLFDLFVNDAFGAAHRGQPSIVGFAAVLPSVAGRIVEREYRILSEITQTDRHPWTLVLGGSKIADKTKTLARLMSTERVDHALIGGLMGNIFLAASGKIHEEHGSRIPDYEKVVSDVKMLLGKYEDKIVLPVDAVIDRNGKPTACNLKQVGSDPILDIGPGTVELFSSKIRESVVVFANGPMGYFEREEFSAGTYAVLDAIADFGGTSVVGGGHLGSLAERRGIVHKITHISTGGGATIEFLTGKKLQLIDALEKSAQTNWPAWRTN
ncbi:MAG: phosphoglycerate kinase [Candidatus Thorarchaeota archaeon]